MTAVTRKGLIEKMANSFVFSSGLTAPTQNQEVNGIVVPVAVPNKVSLGKLAIKHGISLPRVCTGVLIRAHTEVKVQVRLFTTSGGHPCIEGVYNPDGTMEQGLVDHSATPMTKHCSQIGLGVTEYKGPHDYVLQSLSWKGNVTLEPPAPGSKSDALGTDIMLAIIYNSNVHAHPVHPDGKIGNITVSMTFAAPADPYSSTPKMRTAKKRARKSSARSVKNTVASAASFSSAKKGKGKRKTAAKQTAKQTAVQPARKQQLIEKGRAVGRAVGKAVGGRLLKKIKSALSF